MGHPQQSQGWGYPDGAGIALASGAAVKMTDCGISAGQSVRGRLQEANAAHLCSTASDM